MTALSELAQPSYETCPSCGGSGLKLSTYTGEPTECHECGGDTVVPAAATITEDELCDLRRERDAMRKALADAEAVLFKLNSGEELQSLMKLNNELVAALAQEREQCAKVAEEQAKIFGSKEYAVDQPMSSFGERFACAQIAAAIRARGER